MNIYKVSPIYNLGRNAYRYTIVVAKNEDSAKLIHLSGCNFFNGSLWYKAPYYLEVELLGTRQTNFLRVLFYIQFLVRRENK